MESMRESATLALNAKAKAMASEGKTIFNLTAGELHSDTPEYIQEYVSDKLRLNKYTPVAGLPELRKQIAGSIAKNYELDWVQSANVVVTAGAKPALAATFLALINDGDEVIMSTPAWVSYKHLIELAGGKTVEVRSTNDFDLDLPAIKSAITKKTRAIIVNSPNNPTGCVYTKANLDGLASILKDSDIFVISDDIYAKLVFLDTYTLPAKSGFDNLIIINGFSKSQALTGWRIGYVVAPTNVAQAITQLLSHITGNASIISQEAAIAAMKSGDTPPAKNIRHLESQRQLVMDKLSDSSNLKVHEPAGAFYFFVDISKITHDSEAWCEKLLDSTGVAVVPGEAFSAPGFFRLSFVTDTEVLEEALVRIQEFAEARYA